MANALFDNCWQDLTDPKSCSCHPTYYYGCIYCKGRDLEHADDCIGLLHVDGEARGLYNVVERIDKGFLKRHFGGKDWDLIKTGEAVVWYVVQGQGQVFIRCFVPGGGV